MDRPKQLRLVVLAAALGFVAACGDAESQAFTFKSLARTPEGEPIRIVVSPKVGEGFDYRFAMKGSVSVKGEEIDQSMPIDNSMVMHYLCEEVKGDGGVVMSLRFGEFGGGFLVPEQGTAPVAGLEDARIRIEIAPDGAIRSVKVEGGAEHLRQQMELIFNQPGNSPFLLYPPQGLRIGEAIDYGKLFKSDQMQRMLGAIGAGVVPQVDGEAVLTRRLEVDGQDAAEFALNLVMTMKGRMGSGKKQADVDIGFRMTGNQFVAVATGLPAGTTQILAEGRGTIRAEKKEVSLKFDFTITCEVAAPAPVESTAPGETPVEPR
jgi:hypothetical protein